MPPRLLGDMLGAFLASLLPFPDGKAGMVLAWAVAAACAIGAVVAFMRDVPRAAPVLAALAVGLACLLVMGPHVRRMAGLPPW